MKKRIGLCCIFMGVAMVSAFAQAPDVTFNVNDYTIPELQVVPVIDGDLSDAAWANAAIIPMDMLGDSPPADPGTGDLDIILKVAWDNETNAIYFAINVIDESFVSVRGLGSSQGNDGYNNERLEIIIDGENTTDPNSSTTSGFHQQYTFDLPNTWDPWADDNDIENGTLFAGEVGLFNTAEGGIPVSTDFVSVPVFERIEGTLNFSNTDNAHAPWQISDDYVESAAQIRVTDPGVTEWIEAPVEFNWEVKLTVFNYLLPAAESGVDLAAGNADDYKSFFEDPLNEVKDLEIGETGVIGFTAQQNDGDVWSNAPAREHQTNTTGVAGNWNSSEFLTALILGPSTGTSVADWSIQ